jgi:HD-GYP domain-containing protein (c-di-GMP phosphodiesterase class II)
MMNKVKSLFPLEQKQYLSKDLLMALLYALKMRDDYTYFHCKRVSYYAKQLAIEAKLSSEEIEIIEMSALLHDIGKIGIPDAILLKPSRLTEQEVAIMRTHPERGFSLLQNFISDPYIARLLPGVLCHHERLDGKGYPSGLKEEQIPLPSRVILVVDTYDAITTTRVYRPANVPAAAYAELEKHAGKQFDESLVQLFIKKHASWAPFEIADAETLNKKVA